MGMNGKVDKFTISASLRYLRISFRKLGMIFPLQLGANGLPKQAPSGGIYLFLKVCLCTCDACKWFWFKQKKAFLGFDFLFHFSFYLRVLGFLVATFESWPHMTGVMALAILTDPVEQVRSTLEKICRGTPCAAALGLSAGCFSGHWRAAHGHPGTSTSRWLTRLVVTRPKKVPTKTQGKRPYGGDDVFSYCPKVGEKPWWPLIHLSCRSSGAMSLASPANPCGSGGPGVQLSPTCWGSETTWPRNLWWKRPSWWMVFMARLGPFHLFRLELGDTSKYLDTKSLQFVELVFLAPLLCHLCRWNLWNVDGLENKRSSA